MNNCPICQTPVHVLPSGDNRGFHYDHSSKKIYHETCWKSRVVEQEIVGVKV